MRAIRDLPLFEWLRRRDAAAVARVYTIPTGKPFLDTLARAILAGHLPHPGGKPPALLDLPAMTLLLPTRRAARAAQEAFLRAADGKALLLPRIRPIAETLEDASLLAGLSGVDMMGATAEDVPPAIGELERRLVLTQFVMRWSEAMGKTRRGVPDTMPDTAPDGVRGPVLSAGAATPAQAANLAHELARLMDMVETEGVSLDRLAGLVPDTFSAHWQQTLDFLAIITEHWPAYLAARGRISPAAYRNAMLMAEAGRLAAAPPKGPVIVAGVTGSIPATAAVMAAVLRLAAGAVVLPALDTDLDAETWGALTGPATGPAATSAGGAHARPAAPLVASNPGHPEHPQYGLRRLLDALGFDRGKVAQVAGSELSTSARLRSRLVSEAMRPAASTERWHQFAADADRSAIATALRGLALIEAPSAQDEAEVVALILREAAETPGRTAALVTPDRLLARRVAIRLESWGIRVDDSAGRPFAKTIPGAFLDLAIEAVHAGFTPQATMALLKHPVTRLGLSPAAVRRAARALEIAVFRVPYLGRGLDSVAAALARAEMDTKTGGRRGRAVRRLWDEDWGAVHDLVARLTQAFAPLSALYEAGKQVALADLAAAHGAVAEALAAPEPPPDGDDGGGDGDGEATPSPLWQGETGEAASTLLAGLMDRELPAPALAPSDYADFYRCLVATESVRARVPVHPRLAIWGPYEARLQQPDVLVLGALVEGIWPEAADPGPWLNRPMRAALGLPSPEEAIGRAAHDFCTGLGAGEVIMTRAAKSDGVPTVKSRWLLRLEALLAGMGLADALAPSQPWLAWARMRDHVEARARPKAPEPRPPLVLRPRKLSVSDVERWIANPYAIYARHILKLERLDPIGGAPGAALRGTVIHEALGRFAMRHPIELPADIARELVDLAGTVLADYAAHPRIAAFWLPRFERFAHWFAETEPARREGAARVVAEVAGMHVLARGGGPFTLTARADRIDVGADGFVITDYKTGQPPTTKKVLCGHAPQLPLEAAIAAAGGFTGLDAALVRELRYVRAAGGEPAGEEFVVRTGDVTGLAAAALDGLGKLIDSFDDPERPYRPTRRAAFAATYAYDDYAHLARVAEWQSADEDGDDNGEEAQAA